MKKETEIRRNLKLMRQFYLLNKSRIGQTLSGLSSGSEVVKIVQTNRSPFMLSWSLISLYLYFPPLKTKRG
jgi:hypothetical protein